MHATASTTATSHAHCMQAPVPCAQQSLNHYTAHLDAGVKYTFQTMIQHIHAAAHHQRAWHKRRVSTQHIHATRTTCSCSNPARSCTAHCLCWPDGTNYNKRHTHARSVWCCCPPPLPLLLRRVPCSPASSATRWPALFAAASLGPSSPSVASTSRASS